MSNFPSTVILPISNCQFEVFNNLIPFFKIFVHYLLLVICRQLLKVNIEYIYNDSFRSIF